MRAELLLAVSPTASTRCFSFSHETHACSSRARLTPVPVCSLLCTGAQWFDRVPTSTGWNFLIVWPLNSGMCGSPCSRAPCCACYPVIASAPLHACHPDALPSLLARLSCELRPSFALSRVLLPQVRSRLIKGGGVRALQLSKLQWNPSCGRARPSLSMVSKLFAPGRRASSSPRVRAACASRAACAVSEHATCGVSHASFSSSPGTASASPQQPPPCLMILDLFSWSLDQPGVFQHHPCDGASPY